MAKLPNEIKLTFHAQDRLLERQGEGKYNTKNLMRSSVKWYGKDDLIVESPLYIHCLYVCRKAKQKMGYITDGNIEVLYDKNEHVAITIMEVKEKFKPITQYIKPSLLKDIEIKKERKRMKTKSNQIIIGTCTDCGKEEELNYAGLCARCVRRKANMKARRKEYVRYLDLSEEEKAKIDRAIAGQAKKSKTKEEFGVIITEAPDSENYYQSKAEQKPVTMHPVETIQKVIDPLSDQFSFIQTLKECGCEIPEEDLKDVLNVLIATDKLKDIFMTITKSNSQQAMLDLEQALNVGERKLQHAWEYNGFQDADDIKFKGFLTWRRVLKGAIFFWKKLYQTNTLIEMQRAWNAYTQDPNDKILLAGDRIDSTMKRYQITTESISTIFNTRRPFTRVFYATDKDSAYDMFVKWMADRQLHEDKSKTTITELKSESEDERKDT